MIAIIDYGAGNLASVAKAFAHLGMPAEVTCDPAVVRRADKLVLPGVGNFLATEALSRLQLTEPIQEAISGGRPFLGICVGLQWMFHGSEEAPQAPGLCCFEGACSRFGAGLKVPHVGWNRILVRNQSRLLKDVTDGSFVYYTHSYRAPVVKETVAVTEYGGEFSAVVERDNLYAVQFHPEKSSTTGMTILRTFGALEC